MSNAKYAKNLISIIDQELLFTHHLLILFIAFDIKGQIVRSYMNNYVKRSNKTNQTETNKQIPIQTIEIRKTNKQFLFYTKEVFKCGFSYKLQGFMHNIMCVEAKARVDEGG